MSKRIIAFVTGTAVLLAVVIGWQAFGASSGEQHKDPRPPVTSSETPAADAPSDTSTDGATGEKSDDGDRDGFTENHTGKPGENKS